MGEGATDDDLITAWGLVHEAMNSIQPKLLGGITPDGKDMSGPWFEVLIRLQRTPGNRLPMSRLAREVSLSTGGFTKLADRLEREGCARYVVTDVEKDGMLKGPNVHLLRQVCERTDKPVVASGGITTLDDIRQIAQLTSIGVEGAIVGTALYEGNFTLPQALEATS